MEPVGMNRALSLTGISAYADIVREIAEGCLQVLTLKSARRRRGLAGGTASQPLVSRIRSITTRQLAHLWPGTPEEHRGIPVTHAGGRYVNPENGTERRGECPGSGRLDLVALGDATIG
jgi:hypothetical protein